MAPHDVSWEERGIDAAASAVRLAGGLSGEYRAPRNAEALVTRSVRMIDRRLDAALTLAAMARDAGLSPYHFLRTFERLTGVTPHQYILRARLREAAMRLTTRRVGIVEIALDCGFGDVSNFNRGFRGRIRPQSSRLSAAFRHALNLTSNDQFATGIGLAFAPSGLVEES